MHRNIRKLAARLHIDPLLWICIGLFVVYLIAAGIRPEGYFWTIDEGGKYVYLQNTLITKDPAAPLLYPGRVYDPEAQFVPLYFRITKGDQFYMWWTIGFPLLTIPFYKFFGWLGLFIIPAVSGAIIAWLSGQTVRLLRPEPHWLPYLAATVVGLSTPVTFYSGMFWEHTIAVAFGTASIYFLLLSEKKHSKKLIAIAGVLGSISVFFRTEIAVFLLGAGLVFLFLRYKPALIYAGFAILASVPWMAFNWVFTGHPINVQFNNVVEASPAFVQSFGLKTIPYFLFNTDKYWAYVFDRNSLIIGTVLIGLAVIIPFIRSLKWLVLPVYFGLLFIIGQVLFSPTDYRSVHGFWLAAPHVMFGVWYFVKRRDELNTLLSWIVVGGSVTFAIVYILKAWNAAGGLQFGPRYLLIFYPLLVILSVVGLAAFLKDTTQSFRISIASSYLIFFVLGVGLQVRGIVSEIRFLNLLAEPLNTVSALVDEMPVINHGCELSMYYPKLYWAGNLYSSSGKDFESWAEHAAKNKIPAFYRIDTDICANITLREMEANRLLEMDGITAWSCLLAEGDGEAVYECSELTTAAQLRE